MKAKMPMTHKSHSVALPTRIPFYLWVLKFDFLSFLFVRKYYSFDFFFPQPFQNVITILRSWQVAGLTFYH